MKMSKCRHKKGNARFGKGAATGRTGRDGTKKKKRSRYRSCNFCLKAAEAPTINDKNQYTFVQSSSNEESKDSATDKICIHTCCVLCYALFLCNYVLRGQQR